MSNIVAKPFSFSKKIYKAVFKGTPNLLTTEDVNRELDSIREGAYLSQRTAGIICNMQNPLIITTDNGVLVSSVLSPNVVNGYAIVGGVKFNLPSTIITDVPIMTPLSTSKEYVINLYAQKTLVTFSDDSTKEISGAKFEDGSVKEAADHYVYSNERMVFEERLANDLSKTRPVGTQTGYDFIAPLFLVVVKSALKGDGSLSIKKQVIKQSLTTPIEKCIFERQPVIDVPTTVSAAADASNPNNLYRPKVGHSLSQAITRIYSRFYKLEKNVYAYTRDGSIKTESLTELKNLGYRFASSSTNVTLQLNWGISGGVCVLSGTITFAQVPNTDELSGSMTFDLNDLPKPIMNMITPFYNGQFKTINLDGTLEKVPAFLSVSIMDSPVEGKKARLSVKGVLSAGMNVQQEFSLVYLLKTNWLLDSEDNVPVDIP